jgi:hypothetical protein
MRSGSKASHVVALEGAGAAPAADCPRLITMVNTVPPGLTVSFRPDVGGLAETDTVAVLPADCRVPEDGKTLT